MLTVEVSVRDEGADDGVVWCLVALGSLDCSGEL